MRKEQRLRRREDFAAAYRQGRVHGNQLLVLRVRSNGREVSRFGFVVGKAVGGAVVRNRVKRRLRALADATEICGGFDVVIGAKRGAATATHPELAGALTGLLGRAGLLSDAGGDSGKATP
jgi:ribonuclease P protein component